MQKSLPERENYYIKMQLNELDIIEQCSERGIVALHSQSIKNLLHGLSTTNQNICKISDKKMTL